MPDILDSLDDLYDDDSTDFTNSDLVLDEDGKVLEEVDTLDDSMSKEQAEEITEAIKSTLTATYVLLQRAYKGNAFKAMGYETWKEYIAGEFDFTVQRSYQLLDQARVVDAITESAPEGFEASITEAQARDIKRELPKITERIKEKTAGKTPEESGEIIDDIIEDTREQKREEEKAIKDKEDRQAEQEQQERYDQLENDADDFLDSHGGLNDTPEDYSDSENYLGDSDDLSPRDSASIYNFFNIVSSFETLPDAEKMVGLIPDSEADTVEKNIAKIHTWFDEFEKAWRDR